MNQTILHEIGDKVLLTELGLPARVLAVSMDHSGLQYKLRWFCASDSKADWFFPDELAPWSERPERAMPLTQ